MATHALRGGYVKFTYTVDSKQFGSLLTTHPVGGYASGIIFLAPEVSEGCCCGGGAGNTAIMMWKMLRREAEDLPMLPDRPPLCADHEPFLFSMIPIQLFKRGISVGWLNH